MKSFFFSFDLIFQHLKKNRKKHLLVGYGLVWKIDSFEVEGE
jgi:hypothetical protein